MKFTACTHVIIVHACAMVTEVTPILSELWFHWKIWQYSREDILSVLFYVCVLFCKLMKHHSWDSFYFWYNWPVRITHLQQRLMIPSFPTPRLMIPSFPTPRFLTPLLYWWLLYCHLTSKATVARHRQDSAGLWSSLWHHPGGGGESTFISIISESRLWYKSVVSKEHSSESYW